MPISVDNFCRNFGDPGAVEDRVDELEAAGMEAEWNVFLSRVATIQAENETLGKKRKEIFFRQNQIIQNPFLKVISILSHFNKKTNFNED